MSCVIPTEREGERGRRREMKVQVVTQQHAAERWQMTELRERERDQLVVGASRRLTRKLHQRRVEHHKLCVVRERLPYNVTCSDGAFECFNRCGIRAAEADDVRRAVEEECYEI
jgi:hypothetical protein